MPKSKKEIQKDYEKRTNYAAQVKYKAENTRQIKFEFNKKYDADILEKFDSVPNKTAYIKELIRNDIKK